MILILIITKISLLIATVLDFYSRKIIGWATGHRQSTLLIIKALQMAAGRLKSTDSVILHSDKGSQYSSYDYTKLAKEHDITLSMSGHVIVMIMQWQRAFLKHLKKELVRKQNFETREIEASKIFEYIEQSKYTERNTLSEHISRQ